MALEGALLGAVRTRFTSKFDGPAACSNALAPSRRTTERRKQIFGCPLLYRQDVESFSRLRCEFRRFCNRDGYPKIRAEAEVADGSAGPNTGNAASGNARKGRNDDGDNGKAQALSDSAIYPVMRVYRNDLCSLEVTGDAKAWEVVGAMAADGGFTASEELSKGRPLMTVETIVPGRSEDHSTISTKLLAPTQLVNKRAKQMWAKGVAKKKVSLSSGNALARAFQSVVMQRVLAFDVRLQGSGTVRDMANLANEEESGSVASLESRDSKLLDGLAEAVCSYTLANIKDTSQRRLSEKSRFSKLIPSWNRSNRVWALEKTICVSSLSDGEVWENTRKILEKPALLRDSTSRQLDRTHPSWWPLSEVSSARNVFVEDTISTFTNEFVPLHKIEIDTSKFRVEVNGWQKTKSESVYELQLTHAQLVDFADMLDLFYEDGFTGPAKKLRSGMELKVSQHSRSKVVRALWTVLASSLAGGILIVGLLVGSRLRNSSTADLRTNSKTLSSTSRASDESFKSKWCRPKNNGKALLPSNNEVPAEEMEELCAQVVSRMKDAFHLEGDVESSPEKGAWLGTDITAWGKTRSSAQIADQENAVDDMPNSLRDGSVDEIPRLGRNKEPEEVVLLYQVMLTRDGKVLGFQPGNKPAISYWANYPFAEELHRGRNLGPGLIEPGLRYLEPPEQAVAIELICRPHSITPSIAARPLEILDNQHGRETVNSE